jgi:multidrug efflux pump subunit AcrA (membrane-fusion protein)
VLVVGGNGTPAVQVSTRMATVTRGVVQTIVSGSGNLEPARQQDVEFATTGRVTHVYVHTGEHVDKGDLIARVDSSTQRVAVDKANADLVDAEDALTKAQAAATPTPTPQTTAATGTGATVAVAAQATPTPTGTAVRPRPTATRTPFARATPTATAAPAARSNAATQPSSGGSTQSVASAEANVESAQLALKQADDDLDATELPAPMSGTVAEVNGAVGDNAGSSSSSSAASDASSSSSSSGFVVLADLHRLKIDVSLSESDIGKVRKGQSATVTVNAASGEKVAAHVSSVSVLAGSSSTGSGAVSYPVEVTLDQRAAGVKPGMSATADIVVAQASGLVVPSQAVRGSTVTVSRHGRRSTQTVQTGVVGDSDTQIVAGLQAGDQVVVTSTAATVGAVASRIGQSGGAGGFRGGFGGGGFRGGAGFGDGARIVAPVAGG